MVPDICSSSVAGISMTGALTPLDGPGPPNSTNAEDRTIPYGTQQTLSKFNSNWIEKKLGLSIAGDDDTAGAVEEVVEGCQPQLRNQHEVLKNGNVLHQKFNKCINAQSLACCSHNLMALN